MFMRYDLSLMKPLFSTYSLSTRGNPFETLRYEPRGSVFLRLALKACGRFSDSLLARSFLFFWAPPDMNIELICSLHGQPRKLRGPREKGQNPRPRNRVEARGEEASAGDPLGRPSSVCKLLVTFSTRLE